jgi:hypothetical protein
VVPKKLFYFFINYSVVTFRVHPLCLHTPFPVVLPLFLAFFVGCNLRHALQPFICLLLTQHGFLSLLILLFEIEINYKMWDQVGKEAAN